MGGNVEWKGGDLSRTLDRGIPDTMRRAAAYLVSSADRKIHAGVPPPNSPLTAKVKRGNLTLRDSGDLAAGIAGHSGPLWADASTNKKQARLLQNGGVIKSKGKGLWLPAGPNTRRLMKQYGARTPGELIRSMKAAGFAFYRTGKVFCGYKQGKVLKSGKRGKRGDSFALFIIKDAVTIPARPFLYIDDDDKAYLDHLIVNALTDNVKRAIRGAKT